MSSANSGAVATRRKRCTQAAYALHRKTAGLPGGTRTSVWKAVHSGRISIDIDGLIDPEIADQEWARNTRTRSNWLKVPAPPTPAPLSPLLARIRAAWRVLLGADAK